MTSPNIPTPSPMPFCRMRQSLPTSDIKGIEGMPKVSLQDLRNLIIQKRDNRSDADDIGNRDSAYMSQSVISYLERAEETFLKLQAASANSGMPEQQKCNELASLTIFLDSVLDSFVHSFFYANWGQHMELQTTSSDRYYYRTLVSDNSNMGEVNGFHPMDAIVFFIQQSPLYPYIVPHLQKALQRIDGNVSGRIPENTLSMMRAMIQEQE